MSITIIAVDSFFLEGVKYVDASYRKFIDVSRRIKEIKKLKKNYQAISRKINREYVNEVIKVNLFPHKFVRRSSLNHSMINYCLISPLN